jgi:hypothetical protein
MVPADGCLLRRLERPGEGRTGAYVDQTHDGNVLGADHDGVLDPPFRARLVAVARGGRRDGEEQRHGGECSCRTEQAPACTAARVPLVTADGPVPGEGG